LKKALAGQTGVEGAGGVTTTVGTDGDDGVDGTSMFFISSEDRVDEVLDEVDDDAELDDDPCCP
jgi:hypothetical protein